MAQRVRKSPAPKPKPRYRVTNWREYNRALVARGAITLWIDEAVAGRGLMTRAVAMVIDHCFGPVGLHRIEVAIRPENKSSLRVVEKLGIPLVGLAPKYLHIDGDWRDHLLFGITREQAHPGLVRRLDSLQSQE